MQVLASNLNKSIIATGPKNRAAIAKSLQTCLQRPSAFINRPQSTLLRSPLPQGSLLPSINRNETEATESKATKQQMKAFNIKCPSLLFHTHERSGLRIGALVSILRHGFMAPSENVPSNHGIRVQGDSGHISLSQNPHCQSEEVKNQLDNSYRYFSEPALATLVCREKPGSQGQKTHFNGQMPDEKILAKQDIELIGIQVHKPNEPVVSQNLVSKFNGGKARGLAKRAFEFQTAKGLIVSQPTERVSPATLDTFIEDCQKLYPEFSQKDMDAALLEAFSSLVASHSAPSKPDSQPKEIPVIDYLRWAKSITESELPLIDSNGTVL